MSNVSFGEWLWKEMEQRGWSQSEMCRRCGIAQASLGRLLSGKRNPGAKACLGIANALNYSPEAVFRAADLLPVVDNHVKLIEEWREILIRLTPDNRQELREIAEMKLRRQRAGSLKEN